MSVGISNNYANLQKNISFTGRINARKFIELTPGSPVSDAFVKEMAEGIESIDGRVLKQIIKGQNLKFKLAQKTTDAFPEFKGKCPSGWAKGSTWDDTDGLYNYKNGSGVIGLFEKPTSYYKPHSGIFALRHEVGHQGNALFRKNINCSFTDTEGFTNAYLDDLKNLRENFRNIKRKLFKRIFYKEKGNLEKFKERADKGLKGYKHTLTYVVQGSTPQKATVVGKDEAFAEIFATLNGGSGNFRKDNFYKQAFPNTIAYVEKLLYLMGKR